jgi:hypothetical protein
VRWSRGWLWADGSGKTLDGESKSFPLFKSSLKGPDSGDPLPAEQQRHTGAGGFVGSGAIEHNVPVPWDGSLELLELFRLQSQCTREPGVVGYKLARVAQVNNEDLLS